MAVFGYNCDGCMNGRDERDLYAAMYGEVPLTCTDDCTNDFGVLFLRLSWSIIQH